MEALIALYRDHDEDAVERLYQRFYHNLLGLDGDVATEWLLEAGYTVRELFTISQTRLAEQMLVALHEQCPTKLLLTYFMAVYHTKRGLRLNRKLAMLLLNAPAISRIFYERRCNQFFGLAAAG
jgi:hypothetical protein